MRKILSGALSLVPALESHASKRTWAGYAARLLQTPSNPGPTDLVVCDRHRDIFRSGILLTPVTGPADS